MTWLYKLQAEAETISAPEGEDYFDPTLEALCAGLPAEDALALRKERAEILCGLNPPNASAEAESEGFEVTESPAFVLARSRRAPGHLECLTKPRGVARGFVTHSY